MLTEKETETIIVERFELWFEKLLDDVKKQSENDIESEEKIISDLIVYKKLFFSAYVGGTELATELIGGQK